jgi:GT2 family glycosyltransferase
MIPCFNSAALLADALESVLVQDPGADLMQIEVVDDASTLDDPRAVVERVAGGRAGYFRQPHNVGAPANFTTCVRRSRGRWVHILHSDDLVRPDFYGRYRARIEACPDVAMVGARTRVVDADGRDADITLPVTTSAGYLIDAAPTVVAANPLRCVSVVVARHAYERLGGFHPELLHANDWEMWARVAIHYPVGWVDESLGCHRVHAASDTNRLQASTAYVDDCLAAADVIASRFAGGQRRAMRRAARRNVCEYALSVGGACAERGASRLAIANAWRALRIEPSADVVRRAGALVGAAFRARARR